MNEIDQGKIDYNYQRANNWNKNAIIFGGASATFYVYDILWVFNKGLKNIKNKKTVKDKIKTGKLQIQNQKLD
jgi:hypothetical protein